MSVAKMALGVAGMAAVGVGVAGSLAMPVAVGATLGGLVGAGWMAAMDGMDGGISGEYAGGRKMAEMAVNRQVQVNTTGVADAFCKQRKAQVASVLSQYQISGAQVVKARRGPRTCTVMASVPPTATKKVLGMVDAFCNALRDDAVRVYMRSGCINVETMLPPSMWETVDPNSMPKVRLGGCVGIDALRDFHSVDFDSTASILFVGGTRSGKTSAVKNLMYQIMKAHSARSVKFIICTFKPNEKRAITEFSNCAHVMATVTDIDEMLMAISWFYDQMRERMNGGVKEHLFLILDDLSSICLSNKEVGNKLAAIASRGGGLGLHLICGTHRTSKDALGNPIVASSMPVRLVTSAVNEADAALFTGQSGSGAEKLMGKGDAIFVTETSLMRVCVPLVTPDHIAALPIRTTGEARPWIGNKQAVDDYDDEPVRQQRPAAIQTVEVERLPDRQPTRVEMPYIREVFSQFGNNKKAACEALWGQRTPKTLGWLAMATGV